MRGIYFEKSRNRWRARLYRSGKATFCAYFASEEAAIAALTAEKNRVEAQPTQLDTSNPARALAALFTALADGLDAEQVA